MEKRRQANSPPYIRFSINFFNLTTMKKWFFLSMMALVCFSCYTDEAVINPEIKFNPEEASSPYVIPVEEALQTLTTALERIDGSTRSGRMRSPLSVDRVKLAEAVAITRSAELPDVEDLFYIVSFGEGNGSAVLGADRRLDKIYAILDETVLTPEDFYLSPTRSEGLEDDNSEEGEEGEENTAEEGNPTEETQMISSDKELEEFVTGMMVDSAVGTLAIIPPGGDPGLPGNPGLPGWPTDPILPVKPPIYRSVVQEDIHIDPLLNTKWEQYEHYNDYCPLKSNATSNIDRCPAGCVAIATGQILNYLRYPDPFIFDWDLINQNRYGSTPSNEAKDEVARFLYHNGYQMGLEYGDSGTSGNIDDAVRLFNSLGITASKCDYDSQIAKSLIIDNKPVYIRSEDSNSGIGHAWVLDGWDSYICYVYVRRFTSTGMPMPEVLDEVYSTLNVHCNFGWGGLYDGYYWALQSFETNMGQADSSAGDRTEADLEEWELGKKMIFDYGEGSQIIRY